MTRSPGRPRQVSDQQVFDALTDLINDEGPAHVTLAKVAQRLDITGPALGYRYKNKHGLIAAFAAAQPDATRRHLEHAAATADNPRNAIVDALVEMTSSMTNRHQVGNNIAMLHLDLTNDALHQHTKTQAELILTYISEQLDRTGITSSEHRNQIADEIYTTWNGAITSWAIIGTGTLSAWITNRLQRILDRERLSGLTVG